MSAPSNIVGRAFAIARLGNWWFSKIPPLLAVAYLAILIDRTGPGEDGLLIACFVFSVSCVATYGHVINDAFDVEKDRQSGKPNAMAARGWPARWILMLTFLCAGFLPTIVAGYSGSAILLLAFNYLWPSIYSLPGVRLKERGILGIVCDAMGSHVTPTLFALSVFGPGSPNAAPGWLGFALTVTLWAAVLGIKGIFHHQLIDRDHDVRSGTITFSTSTSPRAMTRFLTWFSLWVELPISIALVLVVYRWCPLAAAALTIYCVLETLKYGLNFQFSLAPQTNRASVPFANELFYVLWLPLAAVLQLAARNPEWAWLPVVHAVIFYQPFLLQLRELTWVIQVATRPYRRRWFGPRK